VIAFTPELARAFRQGVAVLFPFFAHCARAALAESGSAPR